VLRMYRNLASGYNGAAYLHLNGCSETIAHLTMIAGHLIKTDSAGGIPGALTAKSWTMDGVRLRPGTYTAPSAKWLEGKGKVVVQE
jgi:hypothetical protein